MQIAYRARNHDDARSACAILSAAGIASHVPHPQHAGLAGGGQPEIVPVLVDNRCLGAARRALQLWASEHAAGPREGDE